MRLQYQLQKRVQLDTKEMTKEYMNYHKHSFPKMKQKNKMQNPKLFCQKMHV